MPTSKTLPNLPAGTIASRRAAAKRKGASVAPLPAETTAAQRQRPSLAEAIRNPVGHTATQHAKNVAHAATHLTDAELRDVARTGTSEAVRIIASEVLKERGGVVGTGKALAGAKPSKSKVDRTIAKAVKAAAKTPEAADAARKATIAAGERLNAERLIRHLPGLGPVTTSADSWLQSA